MMKRRVHVSLIDFLKVLFNQKSHVLNVGKTTIVIQNDLFIDSFVSFFVSFERSVSTKNDLVRDISLQLPYSSTNGTSLFLSLIPLEMIFR